MSRWLYYALGGGWGHLNRGLALARVAAARGHVVQLLANSPFLPFVAHALPPGCRLHPLPPGEAPEPAGRRLRGLLARLDYDLIVVDCFPRGLGGELAAWLPTCPVPRVLIHRDVTPAYVQAGKLSEYVARHYQLILIPGEGETLPLADLPRARQTPPWLLLDPEQLPDRARAREVLGLSPASPTRPCVLLLAAGQPEEQQALGALSAKLAAAHPGVDFRCLAAQRPAACPPELWRFHYPALACLPAADLVIGGGGYHTVHECAAVGVPLLALPRPRLYDRQRLRLQHRASRQTLHVVDDPASLVEGLTDRLTMPRLKSTDSSLNGCHLAVEYLETLSR